MMIFMIASSFFCSPLLRYAVLFYLLLGFCLVLLCIFTVVAMFWLLNLVLSCFLFLVTLSDYVRRFTCVGSIALVSVYPIPHCTRDLLVYLSSSDFWYHNHNGFGISRFSIDNYIFIVLSS